MDTVILAAGRSSRLAGVVPPYHKPLMVHNGRPLIVHATQAAADDRSRTIVVAAPENVRPIVEVLEHNPRVPNLYVIVQTNSDGPGAAFLLGSELVKASHTLVLMSDNTGVTKDFVEKFRKAAGTDPRLIVSTKKVPFKDRARYTRIKGGRFIEDPDVEGGDTVWCGPLVVPTTAMREVLLNVKRHETLPELKLGKYLGYLELPVREIDGSGVEDIGTEEAVS